MKLTIQAMTNDAIGREGAQNPQVRAWALAAIKNTPDRDDYAQASAIFQAVKSNIRFVGEFSETVQTPLATLQLRAGDCDDFSTLTVALLRSIGIPARFDTIATGDSRDFSHVFALAGIRRGGKVVQWLPLDSTVPFARAGWKAPGISREKIWGTPARLGSDDTQVTSPKVQNAIALIGKGAEAITSVAGAIKNRNNTAGFYGTAKDGTVSSVFNASPTVLALGAVALAIPLLMLTRRR